MKKGNTMEKKMKKILVLALIPAAAFGQASPTSLSTYWAKIGQWTPLSGNYISPKNISTPIPLNRIVDFDVSIYSNPDGSGNRFVSRFDKKSAFAGHDPAYSGRGGVMNLTRQSSGNALLELWSGVNFTNGQGSLAYHFQQGYHDGLTGNRGWVRVAYTGSPVSTPVPYAAKAKIVPIGPWDMTYPNPDMGGIRAKELAWNTLGIDAHRVMGYKVTIHSNPLASGNWANGIADLHRGSSQQTMPSGGGGGSGGQSGGFAILDQRRNKIHLINLYNDLFSYFGSGHTGTSVNRGFVRVDYLAGSCEQGGAGYLLKAIPSTKTGNCAGTGNLVIEGAGADVWNNKDEFTYVYKSFNSVTHKDRIFQAKVESQGNSNTWAKTGVMVRMGTDAGNSHVSMMVTPGAGVQFTRRNGYEQPTAHVGQTNNTVKAPVWLRIVKSGNNFTGWYSFNGTNWISVPNSNPTTLNTSSTYFAGLAATSASPKMNNSTLSNLQF